MKRQTEGLILLCIFPSQILKNKGKYGLFSNMIKFSSLLLRIPLISVHSLLSHVNSKVGFPYLVLRYFQFTGKSIAKLTYRSYAFQDAMG